MAVAASLALAGSCSELAGPRVPDVVVTHSEGWLLTHSLKPRLSVKVCSFGLSTCVKTLQVSISEEESQNLSSQVLPPGLLVIHDASGGGQHHLRENSLDLKGGLHWRCANDRWTMLLFTHLSKLPRGQQVVCPLLDIVDCNVKPGENKSRQHCRLSICEYWQSLTNTVNTVSVQKIPVTILIPKQGPCQNKSPVVQGVFF